ncbi:MAG TPA: 50S ribosomal protein L30 [Candidatus Bathyarchaeia archaeon]|nr:50S ribosomal protein L30 [Candidatus Bathyarchaeia archaeon]
MAEQQTETYKCIVAVKVRGEISAQRQAKETTSMLHLTHSNHAVILDSRPAFRGMLKRAQSYVTWGEASKETVMLMIKKRGKIAGGKAFTDEAAQKLGFKSVDNFAEAVAGCKVDYWKLEGVQHVFRLHPPKKGYKGKTKRSYRAGGEAGYRGEAINELVKRMV